MLQGKNIIMKAYKRLSCWLDLCKWCQRNFSLLRNALFTRLMMHIHGNSHQSNWYTQSVKLTLHLFKKKIGILHLSIGWKQQKLAQMLVMGLIFCFGFSCSHMIKRDAMQKQRGKLMENAVRATSCYLCILYIYQRISISFP